MKLSPKEQLSQLVEKIFKSFINPGIHICDLTTGGSKSFSIAKLTYEYYPDYFDRIIILCVQTKLVDNILSEFNTFINSDQNIIKEDDILIIKNNKEQIIDAITNNSINELIDQMDYRIGQIKNYDKLSKQLNNKLDHIREYFSSLSSQYKEYSEKKDDESFIKLFESTESDLRNAVKDFILAYNDTLDSKGLDEKKYEEELLRHFPALTKVYPQIQFWSKKVLIMTVQKIIYGIDPIISNNIFLSSIAEHPKNLIIFDESDQAATSIRKAIFEQAIEEHGRFDKGYVGYLQYKNLIDSAEHITMEYYGSELEKAINSANEKINENWSGIFKDTKHFKNIFLNSKEDLEGYRRGIFFCGSIINFQVSKAEDYNKSFICYKKGENNFRLVHSSNPSLLNTLFQHVVPISKFLSITMNSTKSIQTRFRSVIKNALERNKKIFNAESKNIANNRSSKKNPLSRPSLEREIHTLFSRFETASESNFEKQMHKFITTRKNLFVKIGKGDIKVPDYSVYSQGIRFFQEEIDEKDYLHRVRLTCREIELTPEKLIIDLAYAKETSIVLCSATASSNSVVCNFDMKYIKGTPGINVYSITKQDRDIFDKYLYDTYPKNHKIQIVPIIKYEYNDKRINHLSLPERYKAMFSDDAQKNGLADTWFRLTLQDLNNNVKDTDRTNFILFQFYRLFQFIEAYHFFITHDDIHSMLFFQNRSGDKDKNQYIVLSCLIDGSYKDFSELGNVIPTDWNNEHIFISKNKEEVDKKVLSKLSQDKDAKLMLITAFNSFKAGANLQYQIPEGLDYIAGDNWDTNESRQKKDWDAIYLQTPTNYLSINENDDEDSYEISIYNAMLNLMMLYERGCLSLSEVKSWMYKAISNKFYFSEKNNPGIIKDKSAWVQTIIEQTVGRLCRTKNKPHTTYILYDESMEPYFGPSVFDKSLTKEFRSLATFILDHCKKSISTDNDEIIRCNEANNAQKLLNKVRRNALKYTPHPNDNENNDDDILEDEEGEEYDNTIPFHIKACQEMNQSYKQTIIKKPVINDYDELTDNDKTLSFIHKCYGNWPRNDDNEYYYSCDGYGRIIPRINNISSTRKISPSTVRLDVFMKNPVIKEYFEKHGYATDWKKEGLILHPQILATDYAGEIGEEAFKALVLHYTNCKESDIKHLEGKDYELADFVICKPDGTYKIAFDVKNMDPDSEHNDKPGDMPTTIKRSIKNERLNCEIITVNMLEIKKESVDGIREICGMITESGQIIPSAIEIIKHLIND